MQSSNRYDSSYRVGRDNVRILRMELHNPVFFVTAFLTVAFVIGVLALPQEAKVILDQAKNWSIDNFDWLVMISGNFFVVFCLLLIVLPFGKVRLGGVTAQPEFSRLSWFSMLFAAGMGIGLMFWCVAEPVAYYTDWSGTPLNVKPHSPEAAAAAMGASLYHWGLHPWAIFAVVGLSLAFFSFNKGLPLVTRSIFYPLFGEQCWRWPGHIIDVVAVFATIFGLATSLGLGAKQATGGLHSVFGVDNGLTTQLLLITLITAIAIISVVRGLDRGVKVLSNFNILTALLLLVFVISAGPTWSAIAGIFENLSHYVTHFLPLSDWTGRADEAWYKSWTVFYWAWWISWSPFVGVFIARISRGRSVREFVTAVLLLPTLVSAIWMSVFGGIALDQVQQGIGALAGGISDPSPGAFPFAGKPAVYHPCIPGSRGPGVDFFYHFGRFRFPGHRHHYCRRQTRYAALPARVLGCPAGFYCGGIAHRRRQRCIECVTGGHHHHGRSVYPGAAPVLPVPGPGSVVRSELMICSVELTVWISRERGLAILTAVSG